MPRYTPCRTCCVYVVADVCPGEGDGKAPVVVVHVDQLPALITVFRYGGYCYTINPSDTRVVWPKGAHRVGSLGTLYGTCTACKAVPPNTPGGGTGGPGGIGCGGGCSGGGGGGGGGGIPTSSSQGWPTTLCPGQSYTGFAPTVWVGKAEGMTGSIIFRSGAYCYSVNLAAETSTIPAGVSVVSVSGKYLDCETCIGAYPATVCAGQYLDSYPTVFVRRSALAAVDEIYFQHEGVCFYVSKFAPTQPVPPGAVILSPKPQFETCDQCVQGVVAEPCDPPGSADTQDAPIVWVPKNWLPDGVIYLKYEGWCYSVNPFKETEPRPVDADVIDPVNEYNDCFDCNCGMRTPENGVKARACDWQADAFLAKDLWVHEDNLPEDLIVFTHGGSPLCYYIDPNEEPSAIPGGAIVIYPTGTYLNCWDCVADRFDSGNYPPSATSEGYGSEEESPDSHESNDLLTSASSATSDGIEESHSSGSGSNDPESDPGSDGPPIGDPPPPPPPPFPPTPPTPPSPSSDDDWDSFMLRDCATKEIDGSVAAFEGGNRNKPLGVPNSVLFVDGACMEVTRLKTTGGAPPGEKYGSCAHCRAEHEYLQLENCADGTLGPWMMVFNWIHRTGNAYKIDQGCFKGNASSPREMYPDGDITTGGEWIKDCEECEQSSASSQSPSSASSASQSSQSEQSESSQSPSSESAPCTICIYLQWDYTTGSLALGGFDAFDCFEPLVPGYDSGWYTHPETGGTYREIVICQGDDIEEPDPPE